MLYFIVFVLVVILIYMVNQKGAKSRITKGNSKSIRNVRAKLLKDYGKSKYYSKGQIERVTKTLGVASYSLPLVFAYFSSQEGWLKWKKEHEESYSWDKELLEVTEILNHSDLNTANTNSSMGFENSLDDFSSGSASDFRGGDSSGY